jgi:hypothetical protein
VVENIQCRRDCRHIWLHENCGIVKGHESVKGHDNHLGSAWHKIRSTMQSRNLKNERVRWLQDDSDGVVGAVALGTALAMANTYSHWSQDD